ncbi:unnamed protein product [marine sediment metagenome]|uniref:Uncharacterized protein n=1 Tax=marine sediment metagenome TaxID=412755 RepID=X1EJQ1_9ZZZZ
MDDKQRKEIIDRIMLNIEGNLLNYEEFVLNCVRDKVENWEDDELLNWIGE